MEWRARETVSQPTELKFKNFEQVYILLATPGTYELLYKRQATLLKKTWRHTFNLAITIGGSVVLYIAYFLVFESERLKKWIKRITGANSEVANEQPENFHNTELVVEDIDAHNSNEDAGIDSGGEHSLCNNTD